MRPLLPLLPLLLALPALSRAASAAVQRPGADEPPEAPLIMPLRRGVSNYWRATPKSEQMRAGC